MAALLRFPPGRGGQLSLVLRRLSTGEYSRQDLASRELWQGSRPVFRGAACRKVIGGDLSPAVDAAFDNTGHLENAHVVQSDLFHLPLRPRSFDMVYSLGVRHHLSEPEAGFREILRYGRPRADELVYLYWSLNDEPRWKKPLLSLVAMVRRVMTRVPVPRPFRRASPWVAKSLSLRRIGDLEIHAGRCLPKRCQ